MSDDLADGARTVGAIIRGSDGILLGLRSPYRRSCPNCWDVIGGHIEGSETPANALIRELREEIGITPEVTVPHRIVQYDVGDEGEAILQLFMVDKWTGIPSIMNDEHVALRWFAPAAAARLPNLAVAAYRAVFMTLDGNPDT